MFCRLNRARVLVLSAMLAFCATGRAFDDWTPMPQDVTKANLWSIAFGQRTLIAVGEQGTILSYGYGYDEGVWSPRLSGTSVWLVGAGHGNGRFVVIGDRGTILTSDDAGATWTPRTSGTTTRLNAAAYGNGRWLVVGEQGIVLTSADNGDTWASRPALGTGFLRALAFGQGQFLIGGARGALYSTTDAVTFSPVPIATDADIEGAAISPNRFFVVGSGGLRASATQPGTWTYGFARNETFRGVTIRNAAEASAVGEFAGDVFILNQLGGAWVGNFILPRFLATAVVQGENEVVSVGFDGNIARSSMNALPFLLRTPTRAIYGEDVRFELLTGFDVFSYQWTRNGVDIPGATQSSYVIPNITPADAASVGLRFTTLQGTSQFFGGGVVPVVAGGRPEVRDPNFRAELPHAPTLVVPQPDGKVLVAGPFTVTPDRGSTYGLARLNADGSLDRGFRAGSGIPALTSISAIHLLPDGRMYVRGSFPSIAGVARPRLARLQRDGTVDATFVPDAAVAAAGIARTALAPDGRVYVQLNSGTVFPGELARLELDGSLDESFPRLAGHWLIGVDSRGRVLAVRFGSSDGQLVRYLPDGVLDNSYTPSRVELPGLGSENLLGAVVTDNGLYAKSRFGRLQTTWTYQRYLPDGGLDTTYAAPQSSPYDFSSPFRPDGGFWNVPGFYGGDAPFDPGFFSSTGAAEHGAYATLPNLARYRVLAFGHDNSIYAVVEPGLSSVPPHLIRIQPIVGRVGRLTNLSVRAFVPSAESPLVAGFVTRGAGTTRAIVRAIGPGLATFGVTDPLRDPQLTITRNAVTVAANNDWEASLAARFSAVGAFPLTSGSTDAALESPIADGDFTGVVAPAAGDAGTALVELYESNDDPAVTRRFVNVSARGPVAPNQPLIVGFAITGDAPLTVLVRGAGPALTRFGVSGALADPRLMLFRGATPLWENDDWTEPVSERSALTTAFTRTGAFSFLADSKDAAMLVTLAPGTYSAVLTGAADTNGTALVEIYAVP